MMRDFSHLSDLTYREIFALFLEQLPQYAGVVCDYRPAKEPYTFQGWLKDGSTIFVAFEDATGMFTVTNERVGDEDITFAEMLKLFKDKNPYFASTVSDYKPGPGSNCIRIWTNDGKEYLIRWFPSVSQFTSELVGGDDKCMI